MADGPLKTVLMADDDQEDCWLAAEAFAESGAESFITKPATFDEWVEISKSLAKSWLQG